jgi:nascent polypeptide-associated complex subunit alpha
MMPGMNPKQMEKMLKQMGINSRELAAKRVIIELDGENIIVSEPSVVEITMQGQKSYQIGGKVASESKTSPEDVQMVMEQTGADKAAAEAALKAAGGDIAQAILSLKNDG